MKKAGGPHRRERARSFDAGSKKRVNRHNKEAYYPHYSLVYKKGFIAPSSARADGVRHGRPTSQARTRITKLGGGGCRGAMQRSREQKHSRAFN